MTNTVQYDLEEKLQELEQYAVMQLPANARPRFAFKLPQPTDPRSGNNEEYLRRVCAQETGRVVVRGADKKTLYDLAQRGEILARFPKQISDAPFVVDGRILVQELNEDDRYKEDATLLYDALTGKPVHTLPFGSHCCCKTRSSYLFWNQKKRKIMDLMGCSEISGDSSTSEWRPPYCDITCFSSEEIERLIENHAQSVIDAATGHLVFGYPGYMFSVSHDRQEMTSKFLTNGKVVQIFNEGDNLWVGNYLDKKKTNILIALRSFIL